MMTAAVNEQWVDSWLTNLANMLSSRFRPSFSLFEPSESFYILLASGDDQDLERAAEALCAHLGLPIVPAVRYELGLLMDSPEQAGVIHITRDKSLIRIPINYVGKPYLLGAILAHELAHELLAYLDLRSVQADDLEVITDIATFVSGLGKLTLNGTGAAAQGEQLITVGYLSVPLRIHAYKAVNKMHRIAAEAAMTNLTPEARRMVKGG